MYNNNVAMEIQLSTKHSYGKLAEVYQTHSMADD